MLVSIAQLLAGLAAAGLVSGLFPGPLKVATTLRPGTRVVQGLFLEMFLTAQLVFVIIMLASEKHKSTHLAPVGIGIAFFVTELCGLSLPFPPPLLQPLWSNTIRRLSNWRLPEPRPVPRPSRRIP